jgi:hypothetical protein
MTNGTTRNDPSYGLTPLWPPMLFDIIILVWHSCCKMSVSECELSVNFRAGNLAFSIIPIL